MVSWKKTNEEKRKEDGIREAPGGKSVSGGKNNGGQRGRGMSLHLRFGAYQTGGGKGQTVGLTKYHILRRSAKGLGKQKETKV